MQSVNALAWRTTWIIVPFYIVLFAGLCNIFFIETLKKPTLIHFSSVIFLTLVGAFVGIYGTYSWDRVRDLVDWIKEENNAYQSNIKHLSQQKVDLEQNIKTLHRQVSKLRTNSAILSGNLDKFNALREEMKQICDKHDICRHLLDEINSQCDDLQRTIANNERAEVLEIYFDVSLRDEKRGLSKQEYERFLSRLNVETRKNWARFDDYDLNHDNTLALSEFKKILDQTLAINH